MTNLRAIVMLEQFIAHARAELRDLERMLAQVERGETPPELELLAGLVVVDALEGWTGPQEDHRVPATTKASHAAAAVAATATTATPLKDRPPATP